MKKNIFALLMTSFCFGSEPQFTKYANCGIRKSSKGYDYMLLGVKEYGQLVKSLVPETYSKENVASVLDFAEYTKKGCYQLQSSGCYGVLCAGDDLEKVRMSLQKREQEEFCSLGKFARGGGRVKVTNFFGNKVLGEALVYIKNKNVTDEELGYFLKKYCQGFENDRFSIVFNKK